MKVITFLLFLTLAFPVASENTPLTFKFTDRLYEYSDVHENALMHISLMSFISMKLQQDNFIHEAETDKDSDLLIDFHLFNRSRHNPQLNKVQKAQQSAMDFMIVVYWNNEDMYWREPLYYKDSLGTQMDTAQAKMDFSELTAEILSAMLKKERLYLSAL